MHTQRQKVLNTYGHLTAKTLGCYLGGIKWLDLSVIKKKPTLVRMVVALRAFLNKAVIMSTIRCTSVHSDANQLVSVKRKIKLTLL